MAVKAYIIEVPDKKTEKSDELKSKDIKKSKNISNNMKFIVPGCKTGEGCNNCGNCH